MAETCTPVQNYPDACASSSSSSSNTKGLPPSPLKHIACGWELWSWSVVPITSYPMWTYLSKLWPKPLGCSHIPSAKGGCRPIFSDDAYQAVEDENLKGKYQRFNRGGSKKPTLIIATD
ncbi:hypothetical protein FGSG_13542 [Fusarium graminearum PH-1]|uniref:Chromosome 4, complete genome n=1 Tax=Gibberella zeae (strain ATCC MYA-4620 / CBS 123657 / FGSC 9075 / NRRL 31084 / PH-1) TaxID=229533 RepID=I1S9L1_GIBZE|nr:hypothetical protein FGSG_13542 [Fusarium graminearum PH-1]ESU15827.1 hypothetical protein FGSG_13542 [Fusarium graminearum PH-1]CEF84458.1 unnamed protein product [Fusarium graminearum]|eukprot:XP_011328489.1 hypothetical protein FGSG_13542 [Fusarium graminearum PH-1]